MKSSSFNWPGTLLILGLLCAWELSARSVNSPSFPGFLAVLGTLIQDAAILSHEIAITLSRAGAGFGLALVTMVPFGIFLGRTPKVAPFVEPVIDLFRPLPPLAVVPLAMLFLGTGSMAKVSVIFYSASFPLLINTIDATRSTHPVLINVGRTLGLTRSEIMRQIDLPAALPRIMAGVRTSVALALLISVSSEMLLSTDGLGNYLMRSQEQFRIAAGLACILVVAIVSLGVNLAVRRIERSLLAWHYGRMANVDH